jgi:hypothetical protein
VKAVGVLATAAGIAISQACAAEIPLHSQHYSNTDYQFSVNIPARLTACVSEDTNNGVEISLDHGTVCDKITNNPPFATVFANYNVATGVKTQKGLAKLNAIIPLTTVVARRKQPVAGASRFATAGAPDRSAGAF